MTHLWANSSWTCFLFIYSLYSTHLADENMEGKCPKWSLFSLPALFVHSSRLWHLPHVSDFIWDFLVLILCSKINNFKGNNSVGLYTHNLLKRNLHVSQPTKFKPMLFKDQLYSPVWPHQLHTEHFCLLRKFPLPS